MKTRLDCPCGEVIEAEDEDALVQKVQAHLRDRHPYREGQYTREQILFMAY